MRVVKVGGSLLDWPLLGTKLQSWLTQSDSFGAIPPPTLMVIGGGALADVLREADRIHKLGQEASHWLCIRALQVSAALLARLIPEAILVESPMAFQQSGSANKIGILEPLPFLTQWEAQGRQPQLPHCWEVTSDSIAAFAAAVCAADELVLLKSCPLPEKPLTRSEAATRGLVDEYFPRASAPLRRVRAVCLRDPDFAEQLWPASG